MEVAPQPVFPAGLRVLVVDDDPLALRVVEKMLVHCEYQGALRSARVHPPTNANLPIQFRQKLLFLLVFSHAAGGPRGAPLPSGIGPRRQIPPMSSFPGASRVTTRVARSGGFRHGFVVGRQVTRCQKKHLKR